MIKEQQQQQKMWLTITTKLWILLFIIDHIVKTNRQTREQNNIQ